MIRLFIFSLVVLSAIIVGVATAAPQILTTSTGVYFDGTMSNALTVIGRLVNVPVSPGTLTLLSTKDVVVSVPGVLVGDTIMCNLSSGSSLTAGVSLTECNASANDQVTFRFSALVGLTLGSFNYNIIWLR